MGRSSSASPIGWHINKGSAKKVDLKEGDVLQDTWKVC